MQADIDSNGGGDGDIDNTATVSSEQLGDLSQTDDASVEIDQAPDYTVTKTANVTEVDAAGDVINYTIVVENTGNQSLTNITINDPLLGTLTGPSGDADNDGELDVNESWTYTGSYTVQQSDIDNNGIDASGLPDNDGDIDNIVTVNFSEFQAPKNADETVDVVQNPAYTIVKTAQIADGGNAIDAEGDVINYTIVVDNTGNQSLTAVTVSDPLIANLSGPVGDNDNDGELDVDETWTYTGTYTVQQADIDNNGGGDGDIDNTATVSSDQLPDATDDVTVLVTQNPAYAINKTATLADGGTAADAAGDVINYTIVVTNTGNTSLTGVTVSDPLIATLAGPVESLNSDGVLEVGETWTYTGSYTVTQADIDNNGGGDGDIDNTATVSSNEAPNRSDSEAVDLQQNPAYTIVKTTDVTVVNAAGDIINYTIVVANTGNTSLTGVTVSDPLIATLAGPVESLNPDGVLEVGETWTYTGSYTVTQADIDNNGGGDGDIDNTATVSSNELDDQSDSVSVDVYVAPPPPPPSNPAYAISKTADVTEVDAAGDVINYTIVVSNTGDVNLTNVTVNDPLIANLAGPVESISQDGVLNVGETWTYTGSYTVTQDDIDTNGGGNGIIENIATVSSTELADQSSQADVDVVMNGQLMIEKTPDSQEVVSGGTVTFTLTVSNPGNVALGNVIVTDDLCTTGPTFSGGDADNDGLLDPSETWTYICVMENVTSSLTNVATVTAQDPNGAAIGPVQDSATVDVLVPGYTVTKTLVREGDAQDGIVTVGQNMTFTIAVQNTGQTPLTAGPLRDEFDATYLRYVQANPAPDAVETSALVWNDLTGNGSVAPGEILTVTVSFEALTSTQGTTSGDTINTAIVNGALAEDTSCRATSCGSDPLPTQSDTDVVGITRPEVTIVKTVTDPANGFVSIGEPVTFTIAVTNTGDTTLVVVEVVDIYPPDELQYLRSSLTTPPSLVESGKVGWADITDELGDIAPGTAVSFTVTFRFTGAVSTSATNVAELGVVLDENQDGLPPLTGQAGATIIGSPTAVELLSFVAKQTSRGIQITWATGAEINTWGFRVVRGESNDRSQAVLVSEMLIPATGPNSTYSFLDPDGSAVHYYWLQEQETTGKLLEYGPIQVRPMPNDMSANVYFLPGIVTNR
ncbi:MAG: hypothetical protein R2873_03005 [Caldilineaceae bacterium]